MIIQNILLLLLIPLCSLCVALKSTSRLYNHLLKNYDEHLRPGDGGNATAVHLTVMLNDINDVREGTLQAAIKASVWMYMRWKDERLSWRPAQFTAETCVMSPKHIWIPDIKLFNSLDPKTRSDDKVKLLIKHDGTITYVLPIWLVSHCSRPRLPKATWECPFRFGSWMYNGYQLDIYNRGEGMDVTNYANKVWGITGNESKRQAITRNCCREPWPEITYTIRLIRR